MIAQEGSRNIRARTHSDRVEIRKRFSSAQAVGPPDAYVATCIDPPLAAATIARRCCTPLRTRPARFAAKGRPRLIAGSVAVPEG